MTSQPPRHERFPSDEELMDANNNIADSSKNNNNNTTTTPTRMLFDEDQQPQFSPVASKEEAEDTVEADEEARLRREREEEESMELARRLMAEEAMASYQSSFQFLRESANQLSQEDYDALQNALEEEEHEHVAALEDNQGALSYDAMLQLGERIGDVKTERWTMIAAKEIEKLPTFKFDPSAILTKDDTKQDDADDSEVKCLVCQCEYEKDEALRRLPCGHCFHADCVAQWLEEKDVCPYCRQCIVAHDNASS